MRISRGKPSYPRCTARPFPGGTKARGPISAAGLATVACSLAVASCAQPAPDPNPQASGSAASDSASGSPAASPSSASGSGATSGGQGSGQAGTADPHALLDPLTNHRSPAGTETVLLSEQGSGTKSYPLGTALAPGQRVLVTASCPAGERVIIESDAGLLWTDLICGNPATSTYLSPPAGDSTVDSAIRVSTTGNSPYWLLVTLQEDAQP